MILFLEVYISLCVVMWWKDMSNICMMVLATVNLLIHRQDTVMYGEHYHYIMTTCLHTSIPIDSWLWASLPVYTSTKNSQKIKQIWYKIHHKCLKCNSAHHMPNNHISIQCWIICKYLKRGGRECNKLYTQRHWE